MPVSDLDLRRLLHQLQHGAVDERTDAARTLGDTREIRAIEGLILALLDSSAEVGWAAATALGHIGAPAVEPLLDTTDKHPPVAKARIADALSDIRDPRSIPWLVRQLSSSNWSVRTSAAKALSNLGAASIPQTIPALDSGRPEVLVAAAQALGGTGQPEAIAPLALSLNPENTTEPTARIALVQALANIGHVDAVDALIFALEEDPEESVRDAARHGINQLVVRDSDTWQAALRGIEDPNRRVWWFRWAHRQHVPWVHTAVKLALADDTYLDGLGVFARWRYKSALDSLLDDAFGLLPPTQPWRWPAPDLPSEGEVHHIPLYGRYGQIVKPGLLARMRTSEGEPQPTLERDAIGHLEVTSDTATVFLSGQPAWSLDLKRPLQIQAHCDNTDQEMTSPPTASVHLSLRQRAPDGAWTRGGLSFHVLGDEALGQMTELQHSFPYVPDDRSEEVLSWVAAWRDASQS